MKILFLETKGYNNGGTERITSYIADGLQRRGFDVYCASIFSCNGKERFFHLDDNIKCFDLAKINKYNPSKALKQIINENKIEYVVSVCHYNCPVAAKAIKNTKAKLILWEHFNINYRLNKSFIRNWLFLKPFRSYCIRHVDKIVVLTQQDKDNYIRVFHPKQDVTVIPNIAFTKEYNYDIDSKTIITCGWLRYVKGIDIAIKVAAKVLPKHPDWKWNVWGGIEYLPNYQKYLEGLIKEYGLQKQFRLMGLTNNINQEYEEASFYVMTSRFEGLPMVLLEAKTHGLPIISFDIETGPREIIQNNVNGFLIEPASIEAMSEKIEYLIMHPEIRQAFSNKSQLDMDKFDYNQILNKWCECFE